METGTDAATATVERKAESGMPFGLRAAAIAAVQAGASDDYRVTRRDTILTARNPRQALYSEFAAEGLRLHPEDGRGAWSFSLVPSSYGCAGELGALESAEPEGAGNRVAYRRAQAAGAALVEWYVNGPLGLEQGFTLPSALDCAARDLVIALSLEGSLSASMSRGSASVELRDATGAVALRYGDLFVHDAGGRALPAHLDVSGQTIAIRVDVAGATYPVSVDPLIAHQQAELLPSDASADEQFGFSVSVSGDTAVVGAPPADQASSVADPGSAYVFVRSGDTWSQKARLFASDRAEGDVFGVSVSVSGDTAVVGAPGDDNEHGVNAGAAYVFVRSGTTWSERAKLVADDGADLVNLGFSVSVSGDTVVAGAPFDNEGGPAAGAAYVFVRSGEAWSQQAKLLANEGSSYDQLGWTVALSGSTAVVGAPFDNNENGDFAGAAYVFARSCDTWSQQARLLASDGADFDTFGWSVAASGDTAVVGAPVARDVGVGSAYVFARSGDRWPQQARLQASDATDGTALGFSVAVSGDTAVLGTFFLSAHVFARSGTTWSAQTELDVSSLSVAISADTVVIGPGAVSAAVFVLRKSDGEPCGASGECESGFCVDGVCCDTACGGGVAGDCQACSVTGGAAVNGTCRVLPNPTPCDDGNLCTQRDMCINGSCKGVQPKMCGHRLTCEPTTGDCVP